MKTASLPSSSSRLMDFAPSVAVWSWKDSAEAEILNKTQPRPLPAIRPSRIPTQLLPLILEKKVFQLPFNPPRFKRNKKGELKEEKMAIRYLAVTAGNLQFRIMRNTDPAKVILRAREVARRCGEAAADQFRKAAAEIVPPVEREKSRPPLSWETPACGITTSRFRKSH